MNRVSRWICHLVRKWRDTSDARLLQSTYDKSLLYFCRGLDWNIISKSAPISPLSEGKEMTLDFTKVCSVFHQTEPDLRYATRNHTWSAAGENGKTMWANLSRIGEQLLVPGCFQSWLTHVRQSILALRFCLAPALILSPQCVAAC